MLILPYSRRYSENRTASNTVYVNWTFLKCSCALIAPYSKRQLLKQDVAKTLPLVDGLA